MRVQQIVQPRLPSIYTLDEGGASWPLDAFEADKAAGLSAELTAAAGKTPFGSRAANLITSLVRPSRKHRDDLSRAIGLVGYAPLTADKMKKAERIFAKLTNDPLVGNTAVLWSAICERMRGNDARHIFQKILSKEPNNRLALLNLAANYLTTPCFDREQELIVFTELKDYLTCNPKDYFARLLEALLVDDLHSDNRQAVILLEQLYLEKRDYTPGISAMAAILCNTGKRQAGIDYAREAARISPWNFQALALANYEPNTIPEKFKNYYPTEHVSFSPRPSYYESLLFGNYFLQDPQGTPKFQ